MSQLRQEELEKLSFIADELRESFGERGHHIGEARSIDPGFRENGVRSSLVRGLMLNAVKSAASRVGMQFESVRGGALDLRYLDSFHERRYRVLKGRRRADGSLHIATNNDSGLLPASRRTNQDSLIEVEPYVFAVTVDDDDLVDGVVIARQLDVVVGTPGHLVLGPEISLGSPTNPFDGAFRPHDEDLAGFDVDEDLDGFDEDDGGPGAAAS